MASKLLTESDFHFLNNRLEDHIYQSSDNRTWKSNVEDIYGGDNFADFCEDYFELLDEENYQGNAVVNYTEREVSYTRIIEHKHFAFGKQAYIPFSEIKTIIK